MKANLIVALAATALVATSAGQNLLINGGFEDAPVLGAGQTGLVDGDQKMIVHDSMDPIYASSILAVSGWANALNPDLASDQGLAKLNELPAIQGQQCAFINNWDRRFSQTVTPTLVAGQMLTVNLWVGSAEAVARATRISLISGVMNPANLDAFDPTAYLLVEMTAATPGWTGFSPDIEMSATGWTYLEFTYVVQAADMGRPLTLALRTEDGSVGPVYYDAAYLSVPEPASLGILAIGLAALAVRRRR